jgi:hypothetical protein
MLSIRVLQEQLGEILRRVQMAEDEEEEDARSRGEYVSGGSPGVPPGPV